MIGPVGCVGPGEPGSCIDVIPGFAARRCDRSGFKKVASKGFTIGLDDDGPGLQGDLRSDGHR